VGSPLVDSGLIYEHKEMKMFDGGAVLGVVSEKVGSLLSSLWALLQATHIQEQIKNVDVVGLFSNPWFMVPFVLLILYQLYKQDFRDMIIEVLFIGVWYLSGTSYMQTLVVGDQLQISKIIPLLFGGAVLVAIVMYLFFGRSD